MAADPKAGAGTISSWFNSSAYQVPAAGTFGNVHRNSIYGPGLTQMNMSIRKSFKIYEGISFDFSANSTNFLNHPSFGIPDAVIGPGHQAKITSTTVGGRNVELIGKIRF